MTTQALRGGAAVGRLADLNPIELTAVMYFRQWSESAGQHAERSTGLERQIGTDFDCVAMQALDRLCTLCALHGRRQLVWHGSGCACLGADENCLAQMIGAASEGEREDAMMMAYLIVRPDFAPALAALSEQAGMALRKMKKSIPVPTTGHHTPNLMLH